MKALSAAVSDRATMRLIVLPRYHLIAAGIESPGE
jgi:hypothetical protein